MINLLGHGDLEGVWVGHLLRDSQYHEAALPGLLKLLEKQDDRLLYQQAGRVLSKMPRDRWPALEKALEHGSPRVHAGVAWAFGNLPLH